MKLLHIDSSIQGVASASRELSASVVEHLRAKDPMLSVTYRDVVAKPLEHLTVLGLGSDESADVLNEFMEADVVVIGAALYNFSVPSQLKAWIDRILVAGKTFSYTEQGPVGHAAGKRIIVTLTRGGVYSGDSPAAPLEHAEGLLRATLGFIGTSPEFIIAEGLALGENARAQALARAHHEIVRIAAIGLAA
jgi:FMN-dependent NADH-azoreductase